MCLAKNNKYNQTMLITKRVRDQIIQQIQGDQTSTFVGFLGGE